MYFCITKKQRYNRGFKVNGFLAQLVEQWIENPCVPGSIPGETTKPPEKVVFLFLCNLHLVNAKRWLNRDG